MRAGVTAPRPLSRTRSQDARAGRRRLSRWLNTNMVWSRSGGDGENDAGDMEELLKHLDIAAPGAGRGGAFAALWRDAPGMAAVRTAFRHGQECTLLPPPRALPAPRVTVRDVLAAAWRRVERGARVTLLREARRAAGRRSEGAPRAWIEDAEEIALRVLDGSLVKALQANRDLQCCRSGTALTCAPRLVLSGADAAAAVTVEFAFASSHARSLLQAVAVFYGVRAEAVAAVSPVSLVGGSGAGVISVTAERDPADNDTSAIVSAKLRKKPTSRRARRAAIFDLVRGEAQVLLCRLSLRASPSAEAARDREAIAAVRRALADAWGATKAETEAEAGGSKSEEKKLEASDDELALVPLIAVHVRTLAEEGAEALPRAKPKFSYGRTAAMRAAADREASDDEASAPHVF